MTQIEKQGGLRRDLLLAGFLIVAGVGISGLALTQVDSTGRLQLAQGTPHPPQSTPGAESKPTAPSSDAGKSEPRPHEIAPQPARPDADAVESGAKPALPPAPPEKVGEPIQPKGG